MTKGINNWSEDSRPREKLLMHGAGSLSVAELMAILIGSGTPDKDAVSLMNEVYDYCGNNFTTLAGITYDELTSFNGIGPAKAITILAALELARRRMAADLSPRQRLDSPDVLYQFFRPYLCDKSREEFHVVLLNSKLQAIGHRCISQGDVKGTVVEPRMVFNYVVTKQATAFAVAHNHPSGSPTPSNQDRQLTKRLNNVAHELGVQFIDHLIICDGTANYYSFSANGEV